MAIKFTTWRPDTCGCEIVYEWDDNVPGDNRIHTLKHFNTRCIHHSKTTISDDLESARENNIRKNTILKELHDNNIDDVKWDFDEDRNLIISLPESANKQAAQALLNGKSKVKVA